MSTLKPLAPIWQDVTSGLTVWVRGAVVEFTMPDGWSGRLTPSEAATTAAGFVGAVAEAQAWADRWDATTGCYSKHPQLCARGQHDEPR